jgi:peptide-methionine (S)-S-oxide reductase
VTRPDRPGGRAELDRDAGLSWTGETETETATFGMGCFWGPDARFGAMEGVVRTRVGYAGGTSPDPGYYALGDHTEVVRVEYDPAVLGYEDLLDVFWSNHDPTSDAGKRQYRAVVLAADEEQREAARRTREAVRDRLGGSVRTDVESLDRFYTAEDYHQKYELRSTPVLGDELVDRYGAGLVDSTVAARLNGFVAGYGDPERRDALLGDLALPPAVLDEIRRRLRV